MVSDRHEITVGDMARLRDGLPAIEGVPPSEVGEVMWIEPEPTLVSLRRVSVKFAECEVTMWYGEAVRVD